MPIDAIAERAVLPGELTARGIGNNTSRLFHRLLLGSHRIAKGLNMSLA
jgi:hypothetical protein